MKTKILPTLTSAQASVLSTDVLAFVNSLCITFAARINEYVSLRKSGNLGFDPKTKMIRQRDWEVAPIPDEIADRRVEITGPVDRKMIINALNSGANVFMADFEDSNSPSWNNCINGQVNLRDAVNRSITFWDEKKNKNYELVDNPAVLFVRPRGLHLLEKHAIFEGGFVPASLFDFGVYVANNVHQLLENGSSPFFYLPKLEGSNEALLWRDIFYFAENYFDIPVGTTKATVLIETLPAVFQMNEILYVLSDHSAGLNCGRWDYMFSYIKNFKHDSRHVLPDRDVVTMSAHFLKSYSKLLVQTCHRRGAHAMGGMAAQIPLKTDADANARALTKVYNDKVREVQAGHDGTWVAHPGLVGLAREVFDEYMPAPNQINTHSGDDGIEITEADLIMTPSGPFTEAMLKKNIRIGYAYLRAWLDGVGCVPLNNLMEDAATAEISRAQIWQWLHHKVVLSDGTQVTFKLVSDLLDDETDSNDNGAAALLKYLCLQDKMEDFLTLPAYEILVGTTND